VAQHKYRCRVRGCREFFDAVDPPEVVINEAMKPGGEIIGATLIQGTPTPHPRCPVCKGTSDKLGPGQFKCRVRGCRNEFEQVN
jgi:hypothetical protein